MSHYLSWECPECSDICEDLPFDQETSCHKGHCVFLRYDEDNDKLMPILVDDLEKRKK